jgi:hypothetical protein
VRARGGEFLDNCPDLAIGQFRQVDGVQRRLVGRYAGARQPAAIDRQIEVVLDADGWVGAWRQFGGMRWQGAQQANCGQAGDKFHRMYKEVKMGALSVCPRRSCGKGARWPIAGMNGAPCTVTG